MASAATQPAQPLNWLSGKVGTLDGRVGELEDKVSIMTQTFLNLEAMVRALGEASVVAPSGVGIIEVDGKESANGDPVGDWWRMCPDTAEDGTSHASSGGGNGGQLKDDENGDLKDNFPSKVAENAGTQVEGMVDALASVLMDEVAGCSLAPVDGNRGTKFFTFEEDVVEEEEFELVDGEENGTDKEGHLSEQGSELESPEKVVAPQGLAGCEADDTEHGANEHGSDGCDPHAPTLRLELIKAIFNCCDKNHDGCLCCKEMLTFGRETGFEGTEGEWAEYFDNLCTDFCVSSSFGIHLDIFRQLIDDDSDNGCYCTNEELQELPALIEEQARWNEESKWLSSSWSSWRSWQPESSWGKKGKNGRRRQGTR